MPRRGLPRRELDAWPCQTTLGRLHEYLDGELAADADTRMREHLAVCESCLRTMDRERAFLRALDALARLPAAPAALRERVARLAARGPDAAAGGSSETPPSPA